MTTPKLHGTCRLAVLALALFLSLTAAAAGAASSESTSTGDAVYLIQLEGAPLATYKGTEPGLAATSPRMTGMRRLDTRSASARSYAAHLGRKRTDAVSRMESALGRKVKPVHQYDTAFNGLAVRLSAAEAAELAALPGVVRVERDRPVRIQGLGAPPSISISDDRADARPAQGTSTLRTLILPILLLLFALWGAARRRRRWSRLWVLLSATLLVLMAACGGSDDERGSDPPLAVESPAALSPSPGAAWIGAQGVWTGADTGDCPAPWARASSSASSIPASARTALPLPRWATTATRTPIPGGNTSGSAIPKTGRSTTPTFPATTS